MRIRIPYFAAVLTAAIGVFAFGMQTYAQQSDNGAAVINTYGQTGNSATGGDNATGGTVTYQTGPSTEPASGYASLSGAGISTTPNDGSTGMAAQSNSAFKFDLGATGPQSTITITGFAGQSNGATAPSSATGNYADGGNGTGATLNGFDNGAAQCNTITGDGYAGAHGKTSASSSVAPNGLSAISTANTAGGSKASGSFSGGTPQLTTGANGAGGVEAGAFVSGPNGSGAEGNFAANAQYGATGSGSSSGSLNAGGKTTTNVSPTGNAAQASTTVWSHAQSQ